MIRFLLRAAGFLLVAVAFAILVVDGSRSIAGGRVLLYPLGDVADWLGGARAGAAAGGGPELAQRAAAGLLAAPASLAAGALGLLLLLAGRSAPAGVGRPGRG